MAEFIFDVTKIKPLRGTHRFRPAALYFEEHGEYPQFPEGSMPFKRYWDEEINRSLNGYTDHGDYIPGYFYFYLNYGRMQVVHVAEGSETVFVDSDSVAGIRTEGFPLWYDGDYEYFSYLYEAIRRGKHACLLKTRNIGYEQPNDEPVLTPHGFVTIGQLKKGDFVVGRNGKPTKVLEVIPQGIKDVYEVELHDGRKVRCGLNHLWWVFDVNRRYRVMSTKNMLDVKLKIGNTINKQSYYLRIPPIEPVEFPEKMLSVDPYVMGVLLGGGDLTSSPMRISSDDVEIIEYVRERLGVHYRVVKSKHTPFAYNILSCIKGYNGLSKQIKRIGLSGKSYMKFIPSSYKLSSVEQRLELVRGLMDTDGTININGSARFISSSEGLVDDLAWVLRSLGIRCHKSKTNLGGKLTDFGNGDKSIVRDSWVLFITSYTQIFKLKRKADIFSESLSRRTYKNQDMVSIRAVRATGEKHESTCIYVENKDHLYITTDFVVTHNSYKTGSMFNRNYFLKPGSKNYAIADDKDYLIKDGLLTKTWAMMNFIDAHTPWTKRRHFKNTDLQKRASFEENKVERGYLSEIMGITMKNNPDAVRGIRGDIIDYEEAGAAPHLLRAWNISQQSVERGKVVFGLQIAGGCVCAGTKVWTNSGRLINIEDLEKQDGILGYDGYGAYKENVEWFKSPSIKLCYRITTSGGDHIECSEDHPLMWTKPHWRKRIYNVKKNIFNKNIGKFVTFTLAKDIKVGDQLITIDKVPVFGKRRVKDARLIGLMIGDGNYSKKATPQLACSDEKIYDYIKRNYETRVHKQHYSNTGGIYRSVSVLGFRDVLQKAGIYGQVRSFKTLPKDIHEYNKESLANLLAGYFDADGHVSYDKKKKIVRVVLTSNYKKLLEEVKYQLVKFGIHGKICKENRSGGYVGGQDFVYRLYITTVTDVWRFADEIKLLCEDKRRVLEMCYVLGNLDRTRINRGYFKLNPDNNKGHFFVGQEGMVNMRMESVLKVECIGPKKVYNLHTGHTNTYISNRFITKQTGGTEGANFLGLKEMFYNPRGWNVLPCRNIWSKNAGPDSVCGFFWPGYKNLEGFILDDGISSIEGAITYIEKKRKIKAKETTDPNALKRAIAEIPLTPEEATLRISGTVFPVAMLEDHLSYVETHPKEYRDAEHIGRIRVNSESGNLEWKPDNNLRPIYDFPLRDNKYLDGCIVIYEMPQKMADGTIPWGRYISGLDPFDDDESSTTSLGAAFILDRFTDRIVAEYTGRPSTAKEYYETLRKLLVFYNAQCLYESNYKGIFSYFENRNCLYLLADTPQYLKDTELTKVSAWGNKGKGVRVNEAINKHGRELIKTWLLEPAVKAATGDVFNLHRVRCIPLLKEFIEWVPELNADRISALSMLMILRESMERIAVETEEVKPVIDEFFMRQKLFRENLADQDPFK